MTGLASSVPALLLALVLIISGVAKVRDRTSVRESFITLRMPPWLSRGPAPTMLPWGELVLAALLLVTAGPLAVIVTAAALTLFLAYLVVIVRAVGFDEPVECGCLGRLGLGVVGPVTVVRNVVLVALAGWAVADALGGASVIGRWLAAEPAGWAWLAVAASALVTGGLMVHAGRGAGTERPDGSADPMPSAAAVPVGDEDPEADYERTRIPHLPLTTTEGSTVTLRQLARTRARLLIFINPGCGACIPALEAVPGIRQQAPQLGIHLVFTRATDAESAYVTPEALGEEWFIDPERIFTTSMEMGSPAAVLLGADGYLAGGPVVGAAAVTEFFDDIVDALAEAPVEASAG